MTCQRGSRHVHCWNLGHKERIKFFSLVRNLYLFQGLRRIIQVLIFDGKSAPILDTRTMGHFAPSPFPRIWRSLTVHKKGHAEIAAKQNWARWQKRGPRWERQTWQTWARTGRKPGIHLEPSLTGYRLTKCSQQ